jgi:enoyl-CoA hydratase/carnithine racemase
MQLDINMASAKKRLEQVSDQIQGPEPRTGVASPSIQCTTREHSPGHNVATITVSNPDKLNTVSAPVLDSLIVTCEQLGKDDNLRAVVLTGAPPTASRKVASFIGGADVQELYALSSSEDARTYITRVHKACAAIQAVPVPVIARVHGFSLGAGLEMMAACDLRIATKDSKFGMPEVKIGLPSVVEAALFPGLIGWGRTRRLVYLAENTSAKMAEEWGLVERIVDDVGALDKAVDEWVGMIVGMGPRSIRNQKRLITKWERSTLTEGIAAGIDSLVESYADGGVEAKEYIRPFLGRKK